MEHKIILHNNINATYFKQYKNKVIIQDKEKQIVYPKTTGLKYELINNTLLCNLDTNKITNKIKYFLARRAFNVFIKNNTDKIFNSIKINNIFEINKNIKPINMYLYPKHCVNFGNVFINKQFNIMKKIRFKKRNILLSIIKVSNDETDNIIDKIINFYKNKVVLRFSNTNKSAYYSNKILCIKYKQINKFYSTINFNFKPHYIFLILENNEFLKLNVQKLINIATWSLDCNIKSKSGRYLMNVYNLSFCESAIKDCIKIYRDTIKFNKTETQILKKFKSQSKKKKIMSFLNLMNYSVVKKKKQRCYICFVYLQNTHMKCGHLICLQCTLQILLLNNNAQCPLCKRGIFPNELIVNSNLFFSKTTASLRLAYKYDKPIIYVDSLLKAKHLSKICNKESMIIQETDGKNIQFKQEIILFGVKSDMSIIENISYIDAIIIESDNSAIIKNKKYYGKDFINNTKKINLHLVSWS